MSANEFDPKSFWEARLASQQNLLGTGHRAFNLENNLWLYRAQEECLDDLYRRKKIEIHGKRILDVGSGTGFFVDYYLRHRAGQIVGVDITETSRAYLEEHYPSGVYLTGDISEAEHQIDGPFDIISAMGVLYHIVDDQRFKQAVSNLCSLLEPGGYLILSDALKKPLIPTARHARMRRVDEYQEILQQFDLEIVEILPVYYLANQIYIPKIGPALINSLRLGKQFYRADNYLRSKKFSNGSGMKNLLARRKKIIT